MTGGPVSVVAPGSDAGQAGVRSGDVLLSINGHPLHDVLDYQFYAAEEELELEVLREGRTLSFDIERSLGQDLGIEFAAPTFDGIRRCVNRCDFCFVRQMPSGLRSTLYVRDDDYRYSFLYGNFITLTNLNEDDWIRLSEQRLSPLYVSVHATDLALRRTLLGNPSAPDILSQLRRLGSLGIRVHTQIVLCPGLNGGEALAQTVSDLAALRPAVESVAIVPIGLTRYHVGAMVPVSRAEAGDLVERYGAGRAESCCAPDTEGMVHLSDEIYFLAGQEVPPASEYRGFPQLENGVGLTRLFLDEWAGMRLSIAPGRAPYENIAVACGTLFEGVMRRVAGEMEQALGVRITVCPVVNRFFGDRVTVSGLLTGEDVVRTMCKQPKPDLLLLSRAMLDDAGERTLDEWDLERMADELDTDVRTGEGPADMIGIITGEAVTEANQPQEGLLCAG